MRVHIDTIKVLGLSLLFAFTAFAAEGIADEFDVTTSAELQTALNTAGSNGEADTINIGAGTFNTGGTTFTYTPAAGENFALTVVGEGAGTTILDGGGSSQVLNVDTTGLADDSNASVTIRGLTVRNGNNTASEQGGGLFVQTNSGSITVESCNISNNSVDSSTRASGGGALISALSFEGAGDIALTNNIFANNSADAPSDAVNGGGVFVNNSSGDITLTNNTFVNNSADSSSQEAVGGGAWVLAEPGDITLTNNTFVNNSADSSSDVAAGGGAVVIALFGGVTTLTNNTFTLNSTGGIGVGEDFDFNGGGGLFVEVFDSPSTLNIFNNIIFDNTATGDGDDIFVGDVFSGTTAPVNLFNNDFSDFFSRCENTTGCTPDIMEGNNIDADPLFVDAAGGDVHLQEDSPAIDAGDPNAPALPDTDFEGDPRDVDADGDGTTPDMGADEFVPEDDGSSGGCAIAGGGVGAGESGANVLLLLIPALLVGIRLMRRRSEESVRAFLK